MIPTTCDTSRRYTPRADNHQDKPAVNSSNGNITTGTNTTVQWGIPKIIRYASNHTMKLTMA